MSGNTQPAWPNGTRVRFQNDVVGLMVSSLANDRTAPIPLRRPSGQPDAVYTIVNPEDGSDEVILRETGERWAAFWLRPADATVPIEQPTKSMNAVAILDRLMSDPRTSEEETEALRLARQALAEPAPNQSSRLTLVDVTLAAQQVMTMLPHAKLTTTPRVQQWHNEGAQWALGALLNHVRKHVTQESHR